MKLEDLVYTDSTVTLGKLLEYAAQLEADVDEDYATEEKYFDEELAHEDEAVARAFVKAIENLFGLHLISTDIEYWVIGRGEEIFNSRHKKQ